MGLQVVSSRLGWFGVLVIAVGCRSAGRPANMLTEASTPNSSPEVSQVAGQAPTPPVTFTDRAELQQGVGPMDADAEKEFQKTESGLRYRVLRKSGGPKPTISDTVTVKYRGWLSNGNVFDSSYERGQPTSFPLTGVIPGWTEGMQLVGVGGMIELWVPSKLGYGAAGSPGSVPPHSTLHFVVELMQVK